MLAKTCYFQHSSFGIHELLLLEQKPLQPRLVIVIVSFALQKLASSKLKHENLQLRYPPFGIVNGEMALSDF